LAIVVLVAFTTYVFPANAVPGSPLGSGSRTADEAAAFRADHEIGPPTDVPVRHPLSMGYTFAQPDTTEFEFPEEEKSHLFRDITIFLIASAFVAYFIIKVFLEGDTEEEPEEEGNGKPTPL
jgi:hypothetical protein